MRYHTRFLTFAIAGYVLSLFTELQATPVIFSIEQQPAGEALLVFSREAAISVVFAYDDLQKVKANRVSGQFEPDIALNLLLQGTGFVATENASGKYVVVARSAVDFADSLTRRASSIKAADHPREPLKQIQVGPLERKEEPVRMDPFEVTTDLGRYAEDTTSTVAKIPTSLKEISTSLQILNASAIIDRRARSVDDLLPYVVGMTRESNSSPNGFTVRGFTSSGGVKYWNIQTDGVGGSTSIKASVSTANVERLEILKGPNSVMYGQLSPGGLVNIVTKSPKVTKEVNAVMSIGTYAGHYSSPGERMKFEGTIDLTGPIDQNKHWLYRLIANAKRMESYRKDVMAREYYLYPSLTYRWSPQTELTAKVEVVQERITADDGLMAPFNSVSLVAPYNVHYQEKRDVDFNRGEALSLAFRTQMADAWTLRALYRSTWNGAGRRALNNTSIKSLLPVETSTVTRTYFSNFTGHRYNFFDASVFRTFKFKRFQHTLLIGISGGREFFDALRFGSGPNVPPINAYNPVPGASYPPDGTGQLDPKQWFDTFDEYISDQIKIGDRLQLLIGERHSQWNAHSYDPFFPAEGYRYYSRNNSTFVFQSGAVYSVTAPLSVYASFNQSFTPNGLNQVDASGTAGFPPQKGEQYEGGLKLQTADRRIYSTLAIYQIKMSNVVSDTGLTLPDSRGINRIDGEQTSKGIEFETAWLPVPYWQVQAGAAFMKATITKSQKFPETIGKDVANAPRASGNFWTRYNVPTGALRGLGGGLGVIYTGKRWGGSPSTKSYFVIPGYTRVDAALYYRWRNYDISLNVQNLLDRKYIANANTTVEIFGGEPRNLTFSVSARF
ncbi:MAG: TonB-dependent siderophore receptor [Opitutaceae bacterium]|nr:TonB-dependent siderophore receptor [Opitutaceae bacterium]